MRPYTEVFPREYRPHGIVKPATSGYRPWSMKITARLDNRINRIRVILSSSLKGVLVEPDIIFLLVIAGFFFAGMGYVALKSRNRGS
jgi:hypothetical protein